MMNAEPQEEHRWLQRMVGEWTSEAEMIVEPGKPAEKTSGTETVRSIGGLWIVAEGQGGMPGGGTATMILTLGYDPRTKRYVGTWIGSMMTHLWIYDGSLDATRKVLTLESDGPSMTGGNQLVKYRDVYELQSDDVRVLTSHVRADDGSWTQFMTATYRRKRPGA